MFSMYDEYQQSSMSDQYDMRHHEERMYAERGPNQQLQQHRRHVRQAHAALREGEAWR